MKKISIKDAVQRWVAEFNAIDQSMISTLMDYCEWDWEEVTCPIVGDIVYVYTSDCEGEIISCDEGIYNIELNDGEIVKADKYDIERYEHALPMWGTMWSFGDSFDDYWLKEKNGIQIMSECGFRIYHHDEWGYFFGIDGVGYDFYEAHWIPLYLKRGLKWHDEEDEANYERSE